MKTRIFFYLLFFYSCSPQDEIDKNLAITIQSSQSYKYDLENEVFTIFYVSKKPTEIKFHLTNEERNEIIKKYYSLKLNKISKIDKITGNIYIEDKCITMPKIYTILRIQSQNTSQEIQIDTGCDNYDSSNFIEANKIKEFIKFALNIIQSKPGIKNSPTSDIMYM